VKKSQVMGKESKRNMKKQKAFVPGKRRERQAMISFDDASRKYVYNIIHASLSAPSLLSQILIVFEGNI
jgi:uncharacterized protein YktA (UPF0223 family)